MTSAPEIFRRHGASHLQHANERPEVAMMITPTTAVFYFPDGYRQLLQAALFYEYEKVSDGYQPPTALIFAAYAAGELGCRWPLCPMRSRSV